MTETSTPRRGPGAARRGEVLRRGPGAAVRLDAGASPARSTRWWGRTAPASRRWSRSSPGCTAATAASSCSTASSVDFGSTAESKAAGVAVIYQEPTLFPDLSVTENIFMGRQILGSGRRIDRGAMYAEAESPLRRARRQHRPAPSRARPLHRRPADHRDRQGHLARRPGPDHGRADRGAQRRRGRAAVRRRPPAPRRGPRAGVHLAPLRRGLRRCATRSRCMRDGAYVDTLAVADTDVDRLVALMVGREVGDLFPKTPAEIGEPVLEVAGPQLDRRLPRHQLRGPRGRDRRPGRPGRCRPQRDRPRGLRRRRLRLGLGDPARQVGPAAQPARRDPGRDGVHPRGPPQAGPGHRRLGRRATSPA